MSDEILKVFQEDRIFIDTNIIVYALNADSGTKHEIAKAIIIHCWSREKIPY